MKRYLLFSGDDYYPRGGVEDFVRSFESMSAITQHLKDLYEKGEEPDWANALDIRTGTKYDIYCDGTHDYRFRKLDT